MPTPDLQRIVLTGFMGSGKSTVGRLLASTLGWRFLDLDTVIEQRAALPVPEIFARFGEPRFRELEAEALAATLKESGVVLALGGGAPEIAANRALLAASPATAVVYLAAPFATLYDRCVQQACDPAATARPNLVTREHAENRYLARKAHYTGLATHTIESAGLSPEETLTAVLAALQLSAANS